MQNMLIILEWGDILICLSLLNYSAVLFNTNVYIWIFNLLLCIDIGGIIIQKSFSLAF